MANDKYTPVDWSTTPSQDIGMSTQPTYDSLTAGAGVPSYTDPLATQPLVDYGPTIENASAGGFGGVSASGGVGSLVGGYNWGARTGALLDYHETAMKQLFSPDTTIGGRIGSAVGALGSSVVFPAAVGFDAGVRSIKNASAFGSDIYGGLVQQPKQTTVNVMGGVAPITTVDSGGNVDITSPTTDIKMPESYVDGLDMTVPLVRELSALKPEFIPGSIKNPVEIAKDAAVTLKRVGDSWRNPKQWEDMTPEEQAPFLVFGENVSAIQKGTNDALVSAGTVDANPILVDKGLFDDAAGTIPVSAINQYGSKEALKTAWVAAAGQARKAKLIATYGEETDAEKGLRLLGVSPSATFEALESDWAVADAANFDAVYAKSKFIPKLSTSGRITYEPATGKEGEVSAVDMETIALDNLKAVIGDKDLSKLTGTEQESFIRRAAAKTQIAAFNARATAGTLDEAKAAASELQLNTRAEAEELTRGLLETLRSEKGDQDTELARNEVMDTTMATYTNPDMAKAKVAADMMLVDSPDMNAKAKLIYNRTTASVQDLATRYAKLIRTADTPEKIRQLESDFLTQKSLIINQGNTALDVPVSNFLGSVDARTNKQIKIDWVEKFMPMVAMGMGIYSLTYGKKKDREDALEDQKDLYAWQLQQQLGYQQGLYNIYNPTTTDSGDGDSGGGVSYARTDVKVGAL